MEAHTPDVPSRDPDPPAPRPRDLGGHGRRAAAALGGALLALNLWGLTRDLRNPGIYRERLPPHAAVTLSPAAFEARVAAHDGARAGDLAALTRAVNRGVAHYWEEAGVARYGMRVPLAENYLLHLAGRLHPRVFRRYEYTDRRRAVARGVGLCSQRAIVLAELLRERDVDARVVDLGGHVVVEARAAETGGAWWILDADYGVTLPRDVASLAADPSAVAAAYAPVDARAVPYLQRAYGPEGNVTAAGPGARGFHPRQWSLERAAYALKWLLPALLLAPLAWTSRALRRRRGGVASRRRRA